VRIGGRRRVELGNLNLNLLVHLDALLAQRGVSGAAEQLNLSQPTVSAALARLRRHFGDDLLRRSGNRYELTPLATSLQPLVSDAIAGVERALMNRSDFDAATSRREFVVATSDFWLEAMGPTISRLLSRAAPLTSIRFDLPRTSNVDDPIDGLKSVDGLLAPHGALHGPPHLDLLTTEWRCITSRDNQRVGDSMDLVTLAELPWVIFGSRLWPSGQVMTSIIMRQLQLSGFNPRVEATVGTFSAIPAFLHGTDRVAVVHHSAAIHAQQRWGMRVFDPPFPSSTVVQAFWWHPFYADDRAHRWLRELLRAAATRIANDVAGFEVVTTTRI
jgi:DNA-binding transcriptional LysR family regulator